MTQTPTQTHRKPIRISTIFDHAVLIIGALVMILPVLMLLQTASTSDLETMKNGPGLVIGDQLPVNFEKAMFQADGFSGENTGLRMLWNSPYPHV